MDGWVDGWMGKWMAGWKRNVNKPTTIVTLHKYVAILLS
jgi:hypothetical protein